MINTVLFRFWQTLDIFIHPWKQNCHHSQRTKGWFWTWEQFMRTVYRRDNKVLGLNINFNCLSTLVEGQHFSSRPTEFSHFWTFSLLSSPCSLYEVLLSLHNKNICFYHPLGLFAFSQQYFFFLLQNILFKGVFNESFLIQIDWQTRWHKRAPFLVPKLEKIKIKKEKIQNS